MIKTILKLSLWLLVLAFFLLFAIMGFSPSAMVQMVKIKTKGICPSVLVGGSRHIDFVDYTVSVPANLMTSCYAHYVESAWDVDPARITLDAVLPDFSPIEGVEWPNIYQSDDQIRIAITGVEDKEENVIDAMSYKQREIQKIISRKSRQGQPIYTRQDKTQFGLVKYKSNKVVPIYSGDLYVLYDEDEPSFVLDCVEDKKKNYKYWNCTSNSKFLTSGITYRYHYNMQHLKDAKKIDGRVSEMISIMAQD